MGRWHADPLSQWCGQWWVNAWASSGQISDLYVCLFCFLPSRVPGAPSQLVLMFRVWEWVREMNSSIRPQLDHNHLRSGYFRFAEIVTPDNLISGGIVLSVSK